MAHEPDRSNAIIRPPIALLIALGVGLAFDWLYPLPFVPVSVPHLLTGGAIFAAGLALAIWAIVTLRQGGTEVETTKPTNAIVSQGPYRWTRNPIYLAMMLALIGLAIGVAWNGVLWALRSRR